MNIEEDEYVIGDSAAAEAEAEAEAVKEDKIELLKQVIEKLLEVQHPSVAAAFKLLIRNF
jgi:hypothetical protein